MRTGDEGRKSDRREPTVDLEHAVHLRILNFLNRAVHPDDLIQKRSTSLNPASDSGHHGSPEHSNGNGQMILDSDTARQVIAFRDHEFPLGFRHISELLQSDIFDLTHLELLRRHFSNSLYGRWTVFPHLIPRRGPGDYDGVVHAAMLHTGRVLFITADETTLLWNPDDATATTFEDPVNQPHLTPDAISGYSVLCGGHSFLSDGQLLVVGGGGYGSHSKAKWGYKFDPTSHTWTRTAGSMVHDRWYPTVLTLGSDRIGDSREVLVVCGHGGGDMEIYDEVSDTFREVTDGDTKPFPSLYPGLHLLPDHRVFYSRTGWASAGPGGGPFSADDQSAYFSLTDASTGAWSSIAPVTPSMPDRTKGMSVLLLRDQDPNVQVLVLGGADPSDNNSYELIDATSLSAATNWGSSAPFPDGEHRSLASAVLLPDGTVFVCGGIQRSNSPCTLYDPRSNSWSPMAALPSIRDYHSVALLLPSGQVAMAGWNNTVIEVFDPPYLNRGARPSISKAPATIYYGEDLTIESPDASTIAKVVLVRPMAVTHQTDTEQKVLELVHSQTGVSTLTVTAPPSDPPHSLAQPGHYMLFAIDTKGVPSVAKFLRLERRRVRINVVHDVAVAPLSDKRLEVWAVDGQGGLFSTWKLTTHPDANWAEWSNFYNETGLLPAGAREVAVAPLPDGRLHLWAIDTAGNLFTTWKTSTDPNATWVPWSNFFTEVGQIPGGVQSVAVSPLPDGRLELWASGTQGGLFTTWKVDPHPDSNWAPWSDFLAEVGNLPASVYDIAVAPLQDGRLHLWVSDSDGGLFTTWKVTSDPNAAWEAPWWNFQNDVTGLPSGARHLAVAPLSDGRLELWVSDESGGLFSTWKVDGNPNGNWQSPWSDFLAEVGALPAAARQLAVAPLPDGRLHLWTSDAQGGLSTTWKLNVDPNSNWAAPWYPFNQL